MPTGLTVLEMSRAAGIPHAAVCGGRGRCSTCRIRVNAGLETITPATEGEAKVLERIHAVERVRLACQVRPTGDLDITPLLPPTATPRDAFWHPSYAAGREQEIAILFADLRSFTQFAETKLPYDVVFVLNRYFEAMGQAIEAAGGRVDKFIGDGVMALFGIDRGPETGCRDALAAARAMIEALHNLNQALIHDLQEPLRVGIGIHAGPAIIGEMGYGSTTSLTAIGDAVNTASRLETLTKTYGAQLVVSDVVAVHAGVALDGYDSCNVEIRGRRELLKVWVVPELSTLPLAVQ
jgi:adenylate cyclase